MARGTGTRLLLVALAALGAVAAGAPAHAQSGDGRNVSELGRSDLGGGGLNGDVAVVGDTALVGAGLVTDTGYHTERYNPFPCLRVTAKVVDISNRRRPRVAATIPVPTGSAAVAVDALRVRSESFTGILAAIALDDGPSQQGPTSCTPNAADPGPTFAERGVVYYDISEPANPVFLGRYQADADSVPPEAPPCGPPPDGSAVRCATGQHSVELVRRRDGRLLSVSTEPAASQGAMIRPSGDIRIVDVTNPRNPTQTSSYPPLGDRPNAFSNNGCRPFVAGNGAAFDRRGNRVMAAYMDGGFFYLGIADPASPSLLGRVDFGPERSVDGDAGNVTPAKVGDRRIALLSQDDWNAPSTTLRIDNPPSIAGPKFACEANFTLFDRDRDAQIYVKGDELAQREIVYVGRGCPARGTNAADPYLADPNGKIAFLDSGRVSSTQPGIASAGCRSDVRVTRAQDAGAVAVVFGRVPAPPFTNDPRAVAPGGSDDGLRIPATMIDQGDADALRNTLCPSSSGGGCSGGQPVNGGLTDRQGEWGALRVIDLRRSRAPRFTSSYRPASARVFPPPDVGIYAPGKPVARNALAFVPWHAAGLRVLDLRGRRLREVASFVPESAPDPNNVIAAATEVAGVAPAGRNALVVSDRNSGLYVLRYRDRTKPTRPEIDGPRRTRGSTPRFRFESLDAETGKRGLRFFCAFDGARLERCPRRIRRRLSDGRHVLRVRALDRSGNRSPIARHVVRVG